MYKLVFANPKRTLGKVKEKISKNQKTLEIFKKFQQIPTHIQHGPTLQK